MSKRRITSDDTRPAKRARRERPDVSNVVAVAMSSLVLIGRYDDFLFLKAILSVFGPTTCSAVAGIVLDFLGTGHAYVESDECDLGTGNWVARVHWQKHGRGGYRNWPIPFSKLVGWLASSSHVQLHFGGDIINDCMDIISADSLAFHDIINDTRSTINAYVSIGRQLNELMCAGRSSLRFSICDECYDVRGMSDALCLGLHATVALIQPYFHGVYFTVDLRVWDGPIFRIRFS